MIKDKTPYKVKLRRAEDKCRFLTAELEAANEEIEALTSEKLYANPMYLEGSDHLVRLHEEFKREIRSFIGWFKWVIKQ